MVDELVDQPRWMRWAGCLGVDPNLFFPVDGGGVKEAMEVCNLCVVQDVCLEYALSNHIDHGIWGGASERERRRILRIRRGAPETTRDNDWRPKMLPLFETPHSAREAHEYQPEVNWGAFYQRVKILAAEGRLDIVGTTSPLVGRAAAIYIVKED